MSSITPLFLKGKIETVQSLHGTVHVGYEIIQGGGDYEIYEGTFIFEPSTTDQVLETANKLLTANLTISAIPYSEVTNETSGKTITIGG